MQDLLQIDYNSTMNGKWSSLLKFVRLVLHEIGYRLVKRIVSEYERRQAAPLTGRTQGANAGVGQVERNVHGLAMPVIGTLMRHRDQGIKRTQE